MDIIKEKAQELVPYLRYPNFQEIFDEMTAVESRSTQFLLRMEIKRLTSPCVRIMDFRNDGKAIEFPFAGITHFLLRDDIEEFNQLLETFSGKYTNGLYEELVRNHAERKKTKRDEPIAVQVQDFNKPSRFMIETIRFASYAHRRDERMFYCSPIIISFPDGSILEAKTSDLSCSGIKILLPRIMEFRGRENIFVTFTGLIELYPKAQQILTNIPYETLGIDTRDVRAWLKTRCLTDNKDFEKFVLWFQEVNKYRYRIDIDYLAYTMNIKALEYQYLPKIIGIPLIFSNDPEPKLMYALKSDFNHDLLDYWRDERSDDKLKSLFTNERFQAILKKPEGEQYTYIYSFKHTTQNHTYFISATIEELIEKDLVQTFFSMSNGRTSFRAYKFEIKKVILDKKDINNIVTDIKSSNADAITATLGKIGYICLFTRIDTENDYKIYQKYIANVSANNLQQFTHKTDDVERVKLEYLQYITPRKEQRYIYQTAITIANNFINPTQGWTRDISTTGLQVELSTPVECFNGDIVFVSMPKFQSLNKKVPLLNVPYEIIYINSAHTIVHLKIKTVIPDSDKVSKFLGELIKSNQKVLKPAQNIPHMSDMSKSLRALIVSNLMSTPTIFMRGKTNRLGYIAEPSNDSSIGKLFKVYKAKEKCLNMFPIFANNVQKCILDNLPTLKVKGGQKQINILVKRYIDKAGKPAYMPELEDNIESLNDRIAFIQEGVDNQFFGAYSIFLTSTTKPDITEISKELEYIRKCATHKYKVLESNIHNVIAIGDIIDITESIFIKYNFESIKRLNTQDLDIEIEED